MPLFFKGHRRIWNPQTYIMKQKLLLNVLQASISTSQKKSPRGVNFKNVFSKFCNIHEEIPVMEFQKVSERRPAILLKRDSNTSVFCEF